MRNKYFIIIIILLLLIGASVFFFFYNSKSNKEENNNTSNYEANKTQSNINANNTNGNIDNTINNNENKETSKKDTQSQSNSEAANKSQPLKEEEIASFSTKIVTKDSSRQKNISITCSTLNDTLIENGKTFSFCNTIGPSTTAKGYQKADIFDSDGKKKKGLGGGNCQVSTTLYNAVLSVPSLKVTERHAHSNKVPYIQSGKDAAVAYGSYDLKFVNNSGNTIKIKAESNASNITIKLLKLS